MMHTSLSFRCGKVAKNRFILAPLTNQQSHEDGTLSKEEAHWLTKRAEGGFGMLMTCAAFVSLNGIGFDGQMGVVDHLNAKPHLQLNDKLHAHGALSLVQLYHAGNRAALSRIEGEAFSPMGNAERGIRTMTTQEVIEIKSRFVESAFLSKEWGYDGVQLHAAHGYLLCDFLASSNQRSDQYGGSIQNRLRLLLELIDEVRDRCGSEFLLSVRLSPERFGIHIGEILEMAQQLLDTQKVDLLDWSLWDVNKSIDGQSLLQRVLQLEYGDTRVSVAGKLMSAQAVSNTITAGCDVVALGRGAILHHDFPRLCQDPKFVTRELPVSVQELSEEGLSPAFIQYMRRWEGFVCR